MPSLQSHTHRQAAQVNATTQAWQRVCLSQRTDKISTIAQHCISVMRGLLLNLTFRQVIKIRVK